MVTRASWSSTIKTRGFTPLFLFLSPPAVSVVDFLRDDHLEARQVVLRAAAADALSGRQVMSRFRDVGGMVADRSEEHTSELQSLMRISYAVFCLKIKKITHKHILHIN